MSTVSIPKTVAGTAPQTIVGIGASAGGLQALEQFLSHTPANNGLAWIVVQHLDPTQKAMLAELLQRATGMKVQQATQGMPVYANQVYVIPPNTELRLRKGALNLVKPKEPRGRRLPVNILFQSLADQLGKAAIGVILSGMGSDGTLGAQAIKAAGGLVAVQQPGSAQFDSMPQGAIAGGGVDIIAEATELPARILSAMAQMPFNTVQPLAAQMAAPIENAAQQPAPDSALQQIITRLQSHTRHDFSLYKTSTLQRRIERRMAIHNLDSMQHYAGFLPDNPQENDLLFKELLIGVTQFFRDAAVWDYLADSALPALLQQSSDTALRAWCVGCSTGEEAYSLAIVFCQLLQRQPELQHCSLKIFASDLSPDAITKARRGQYPLAISDHVCATRLQQFFIRHDSYYQIKQHIRDMVLFAQHDVILDPPFTRQDIIICRNLLIYFDTKLQRKLMPLLHYSLRRNGILLLGSSETIGRYHDLFVPLQAKLRFYQRLAPPLNSSRNLPVHSFPPLSNLAKEHPVAINKTLSSQADNLQSAADQVLLQVYAPAAVVLNNSGDIVYISGRTGKYLEPAAGKANWNFHAMVREGLRSPLALALHQVALQPAETKGTPLQLHRLPLSAGDSAMLVDVTVQALQEPASLQGMTMIVFRDVAATDVKDAPSGIDFSLAAVQQQYLDEIQALREETRTSKEELQSGNEELQSTNEELQSTNEELTTSKEEMQSMNEELQTINAELQTKLDDLALAQSDLQNTLNSVEIAILFLDQQLNVRRYTDRAANIINLRESDLGRPLSDLTSSLQYPSLHDDALDTLRTLKFCEKQISTTDERWFSVRIMPYRRLDNVIDGVVITLVDISATKMLEAALREQSVSQNTLLGE
ncbi:two-component system, chemotaxis family, CheB/CheR fusion protein [Rheinheimera pacifica]|uniref:Two-component system, chemotaxis family, CheB/CheR fusion protein n=1 Tax=Rheinheimera pacifica TaxID=173990 RepID=A0A1H6KFF7_9GAMM|nr:chemotaxis protein CheB [Rheinheimera pacifica]SEH74054.1 two-component system, chemotaxis family, CheB/CheR fusion protein [Rheinheimera pacifica]